MFKLQNDAYSSFHGIRLILRGFPAGRIIKDRRNKVYKQPGESTAKRARFWHTIFGLEFVFGLHRDVVFIDPVLEIFFDQRLGLRSISDRLACYKNEYPLPPGDLSAPSLKKHSPQAESGSQPLS